MRRATFITAAVVALALAQGCAEPAPLDESADFKTVPDRKSVV